MPHTHSSKVGDDGPHKLLDAVHGDVLVVGHKTVQLCDIFTMATDENLIFLFNEVGLDIPVVSRQRSITKHTKSSHDYGNVNVQSNGNVLAAHVC